MTYSHMPLAPLVLRGSQLYRDVIQHAATGQTFGAEELLRWEQFERDVTIAMAAGNVEDDALRAIHIVASNVCRTLAEQARLEDLSHRELDTLTREMDHIVIGVPQAACGRKRSSSVALTNRHRAPKRTCRPPTTKYHPSPSPTPSRSPPPTRRTKSTTTTTTKSPTSLKSTSKPPLPPQPTHDPVRQFFLSHLSNPYPSPTEKTSLCKAANITRRKLESDLTNRRRRSDWTDMMNTYCGGDKGAMGRMINAIERGDERDEGLLERFGRMKMYLEKKDEQAGEWVLQLAEMVKSGRINELRSTQLTDSQPRSNRSTLYSRSTKTPNKSRSKPKRNTRSRYREGSSESESESEDEDQTEEEDDIDSQDDNQDQVDDDAEGEVEGEGVDSEADAEGESVDESLVEIDNRQAYPQSSIRITDETIPDSKAKKGKSRAEPTTPFTSAPLTASEQPHSNSNISPISSISSNVASGPGFGRSSSSGPAPHFHAGALHPPRWPTSLEAIPFQPEYAAIPYSKSYATLSAGGYYPSATSSAPRKRNISDSSTSDSNSASTSLRSVSTGSSGSTYPQIGTPLHNGTDLVFDPFLFNLPPTAKRPSKKESFTRTSRSRVHNTLEHKDTEASWMDGHAPDQNPDQEQRFHIGSSSSNQPRSFPASHLPGVGAVPPYPADLTPFLMAPGQGHEQGWGVEGGYGLLPHMNVTQDMERKRSEGKGERFTIPQAFEFTYAAKVSE